MSTTESGKKARKPRTRKDAVAYVADTNENGNGRRRKRDEITEELLRELKQLRTNLDEVTEHFKLRIAGQLAEVTQVVEGKGIQAKPKQLSIKIVTDMLAEIQQKELKPRKGRAKDLAKLQDLVRTLSALLPPEH